MRNDITLSVSHFPFRRTRFSFPGMNYLMILLLIPSVMAGVGQYGVFALRVVAAAVFFTVLWDSVYDKIAGKPLRFFDGNAVLTGLLFGMMLPPAASWWVIAFSSAAGLFLGKHLFGAAGGSPFNAVCIAWVVAVVSWPSYVDIVYGSVGFSMPFGPVLPLAELHRLGNEYVAGFSISDLVFRVQSGTVGTGVSFLLVAGGVVAIILRVVRWQIPVSFFSGIALTTGILVLLRVPFSGTVIFQSVTGFSCVAAFFILNDFSSRPVETRMMVFYGLLTGVLTVIFRVFGRYPEGLPFAVLVVNVFMPLFDRGRAPTVISHPEVVRL